MLEVLQPAHLANTGREIARAEVLAALVAEGLPAIAKHPDFKTNFTI